MENIGKTLGERFKNLQPKEKKQGGINSARADVVSQLLDFMGEKRPAKGEAEEQTQKRIQTRMKYWLGRTRKMSPAEIRDTMKQAREGNNPQAIFNWLIKQHAKK